MKDEYIIINKKAIQKRIEECNKYLSFVNKEHDTPYQKEIDVLQSILSQSVPLIPELQKTWNTAYIDAMSIDEETYKPLFFEDYIANLKLNI